MAPFIYRHTGQRSLCTFYTWRNSTNGTCSGNAPPGRSWTGHNLVHSTSAHTHPCPPRSCCTVGPGCPENQWSHCAGNSPGWGRRRPGPLASACWSGCSPAPACPCGWSSWPRRCRTSPSASHPPCGSQPAAASRSWGCRSLIHHDTCRPRPPACTRPVGKEMQSGKAVPIPAALAAGWITMNSSRFHSCFHYPPISVVSPFRGDKSLLFPLLQLLRSYSLNISISGHAASSKHDFYILFPPDLTAGSREGKKRKLHLHVDSGNSPTLIEYEWCLLWHLLWAAKREHLGSSPFPTTRTKNQHILQGIHLHLSTINPRPHTLSLCLCWEELVQGQCPRGCFPESGKQWRWCGRRTPLSCGRVRSSQLQGVLTRRQPWRAGTRCEPAPSCVHRPPCTSSTTATHKGPHLKQQTQVFGAVFPHILSAMFVGVCGGCGCIIPPKIRHPNQQVDVKYWQQELSPQQSEHTM